MAEGVTPTLESLLALRQPARGGKAVRRGEYGRQGAGLSVQLGRGMEYAQSRQYVPGDDARHIDWRLAARTGTLHTKCYQVERERLTLVVADTAPAMYFGTRTRFKSVQAARAAAAVVWRALAQGERLAAVCGSAREAPIRPGRGMQAAMQVLLALVRWYRQPPDEDAGLDTALQQALRLARPGSRILVLAEGRSLTQAQQPHWLALAQHHQVTVLLLADVLELSPPAARLPFATSRGVQALALGQADVRRQWQQHFAEPLQAAQRMLQQAGIASRVLLAHEDSAQWMDELPQWRTF